MSKLFTITFKIQEIDQLLKLLEVQSVITPENAIRLTHQLNQGKNQIHLEDLKSKESQVNAKNLPESIHVQAQISLRNETTKQLFPIAFEPRDLDQLLQVLYSQNTIEDEQAIRLIAKINREVDKASTLKKSHRSLLKNTNLDLTIINATETYYQYRGRQISLPAQDPEEPAPSVDPLMTIARTLESIARTLEAIVPHLPPPYPQSLGFTSNYRKDIIYCEAKHGSYWHLLNEWQQPIALHGRALTCIVQSLNIVKSESAEPKLHLHVQADKLYCLELPCQGLFTTLLLMSIDQLSSQQLQLPITIEPLELTESQELACQLYYQGESLTNLPDIPPPLPLLIQQVQVKLKRNSIAYF